MTRKKIGIVLLVFALTAALCVGVVFAAGGFGFTREIDPSFTFDEQKMTATFPVAGSSTFAEPGAKRTISPTVKNEGGMPLEYSYRLTVEDGGLAPAILVFWNGEFLGTLAQMSAAGQAQANFTTVAFGTSHLFLNESESGTLELQFHVGAASLYAGRTAKVTLLCAARNTDAAEVTYVHRTSACAADWATAIDLLNAGLTPGRTLRLGEDLRLNGDAELTADCTLDLNGHSVTGGKLMVRPKAGSAVGPTVTLKNSKRTARVGAEFMVEKGAVLLPEDSLSGSAVSAELAASYDASAIAGRAREHLQRALAHPQTAGAKVDLLGGEAIFSAALSVTPASAGNIADGIWTVAAPGRDTVAKVGGTVAGRTIAADVMVYAAEGASSAVAELAALLAGIGAATAADAASLPAVDYDLLLPTRCGTAGATVEWSSSQPAVIGADGMVTPAVGESIVELVGIVTADGVVRPYRCFVRVAGLSAQSRLQYLIDRMGTYVFRKHEEKFFLPTAANYLQITERDLGIAHLTYATADSFLTVQEEDVTQEGVTTRAFSAQLTADTTAKSGTVQVTGTFAEGSTETLPMTIRIEIPVVALDPVETMTAVQRAVAGYRSQLFTDNNPATNTVLLPTEYPNTLGFLVSIAYSSQGPAGLVTWGVEDSVNKTIAMTVDVAGLKTTMQTLTLHISVECKVPEGGSGEGWTSGNVAEIAAQGLDTVVYTVPAALLRDRNGFSDPDVFDFVLTQLEGTDGRTLGEKWAGVDRTKPENLPYILIDTTIAEAPLKELDFSSVAGGVRGSVAGLYYFRNQLTSLKFSDTASTGDITAAPAVTRQNFTAAGEAAEMLAVVAQLTALQTLDLSYCNVEDLLPLQANLALLSLNLKGNGRVADVTMLNGLTALSYLNLAATALAEDGGTAWTYAQPVLQNLFWSRNTALYLTTADKFQTLYAPDKGTDVNYAYLFAFRMSDLHELYKYSVLPQGIAWTDAATAPYESITTFDWSLIGAGSEQSEATMALVGYYTTGWIGGGGGVAYDSINVKTAKGGTTNAANRTWTANNVKLTKMPEFMVEDYNRPASGVTDPQSVYTAASSCSAYLTGSGKEYASLTAADDASGTVTLALTVTVRGTINGITVDQRYVRYYLLHIQQ